MTQTVLRFSGIALIGAFVSVLLKEKYKAQITVAVLAAIVLISLNSMESGVGQAVSNVLSFSENTGFAEHVIILQKALGIGYITTITANICKDAGEASLAATMEFAGKIQLLILCFPLVSSLLDIAKGLL